MSTLTKEQLEIVRSAPKEATLGVLARFGFCVFEEEKEPPWPVPEKKSEGFVG